MEQELRMKREAAERAFEAQAEKDRTLTRLEELRFLATSTKDLDDGYDYWVRVCGLFFVVIVGLPVYVVNRAYRVEVIRILAGNGVLIVVDIQEVIGNTLAIKIWSNGVVPIRAGVLITALDWQDLY
nr:metal transporter Nramp3 [Tanacetum cinerariifolium]